MKYQSQRVAYYFFAVSMLLLCLQILYGFIMAFAHVGYDVLHAVIPFNVARATHLNLLVVWLLSGFMGAAHFIIPDETGQELYSTPLAVAQLASLVLVGVIAIIGFHFQWWEGRKFLEIPHPLDYLVVVNVLMFIANIGMTLWRSARRTTYQHRLVHGAAVGGTVVPAGHDRHHQPDDGFLLALVGGAPVGRRCVGAHHGRHPGVPAHQADWRRPRDDRKVAVPHRRPDVPVWHPGHRASLLLHRHAELLAVDRRHLQRPGAAGLLRHGGVRGGDGAARRAAASQHPGVVVDGGLRHHVVRRRRRAGLRDDTGDLESAKPQSGTAFTYDEWDGRAQRYRPAWCTVYVSQPATPASADRTAAAILRKHARTVHEVRLLLDKLRHQRRLRNRQTEGTDIDVDAVVDRYATVRGGQRPDDRLYLAQRRQRRDLVTLLLIDMSASTDAWIEGSRVLDIATESALVLGEVLSQWGDRAGMAGFYSNTRRDCRFVMLKPFDADWHRSRAALTGLEPTGYTRIGPAVRHGTALLQGQRSARKLLLLLSDGKPSDYDRYEGRYGIADIRQAIREAHHSRIHTYALAIDVQAKLYLPQMFGSGSFRILPHPTHLVRGLSEVYGQLAR